MEAKTPKTLIEAITYFSNPDNAHNLLVSMRWPNGVACPRCGCVDPSYISTRRIWKCKGCKKQFSVKVGTIFEDSPLGLDKWLTAFWLVVNAKNGILSYEVARSLGVRRKRQIASTFLRLSNGGRMVGQVV
jgi:transposase-like protein